MSSYNNFMRSVTNQIECRGDVQLFLKVGQKVIKKVKMIKFNGKFILIVFNLMYALYLHQKIIYFLTLDFQVMDQ